MVETGFPRAHSDNHWSAWLEQAEGRKPLAACSGARVPTLSLHSHSGCRPPGPLPEGGPPWQSHSEDWMEGVPDEQAPHRCLHRLSPLHLQLSTAEQGFKLHIQRRGHSPS